jgi:hypothetical protein
LGARADKTFLAEPGYDLLMISSGFPFLQSASAIARHSPAKPAAMSGYAAWA